MLQVRDGQGSEQRRQEAPHLVNVLQKLSVKRFSATSCNRSGTPIEPVMIGLSLAITASALAPRRAVTSCGNRFRIRRSASLLGLVSSFPR
jgi:hypothetical protein